MKETMGAEQEIENIKQRNQRVELDKTWETSWVRRIFIACITYAVAGFWLTLIGIENPWLNAFVPTGGYLLSTFSLSVLKNWWIKRKQK